MAFPRNMLAIPNRLLAGADLSSREVPIGFGRYAVPKVMVVALAGGNGVNTDLPGPDAGYVRCVDTITVVATSSAAAIGCSVSLMPLNKFVSVALSGIVINSVTRVVYGFGETIRFGSTTANGGTIVMSYFDVPDTDITLVRTAITNAAGGDIVIPAPATGLFRRWLLSSDMIATSRALAPRFAMVNTDSVAHVAETFMGATIASRDISRAAGAAITPQPLNAVVTQSTGDLKFRFTEAISTVSVYAIGAYETVPGG